jgi:hypothetical protein
MMADRRMIHKKISLSEQVNDMSEFAQLLFTWMIPHADDFGRLSGSPAVVRAQVMPLSNRSVEDVEDALLDMKAAKLIAWYDTDNGWAIQLLTFDKHQSGLHRRTASEYPPPPNSEGLDPLSATELDVEDLIYELLETEQFKISASSIIQMDRQVRVGNSYLDIVCHDEAGCVYVLEIKRQRLSNASLDQIMRYINMLQQQGQKDIRGILIGYGLASNFRMADAIAQSIDVITYDDELQWRYLTLGNSYLTLPTEQKGTEGKRTEQKGREGKGTPPTFSSIWLEELNTLDLNATLAEEMDAYMGEITADFFTEAVREMLRQGKRSWKYCKAIIAAHKRGHGKRDWTETDEWKQYEKGDAS